MRHTRMNSTLTLSVLAMTLLLAPSMSRAADVVDGGGFFSAETLAKANQTIRDLETKTGHEVRIETFANVPADKVDAVKKMEKTEREEFFKKWLHDRADQTKAHGVFVLICKEPAHLRLWGAKSIQQAGFKDAEAKAVREILLTGFKAKEYDKTLTEALAQLSKTYDGLKSGKQKDRGAAGHAVPGNTPAARPPHAPQHAPMNRAPAVPAAAPGANWGNVLFVMAMVVGGIFLISAVMRMFRGGQNYGPGGPGGGGYGAGGGGGGFMSGLAGGLFGAVAGNWLYNQFSDHHASAGETHSSGNDSSTFGDSSNEPISFDSDSSNSGGTDFGGGDFGGGDFGGGGGDSGGDF